MLSSSDGGGANPAPAALPGAWECAAASAQTKTAILSVADDLLEREVLGVVVGELGEVVDAGL